MPPIGLQTTIAAHCAAGTSRFLWRMGPVTLRYYSSMSATGRNDPYPCGSGRKYKQCCLRAADVVDAAWYRLRDAEGRLMPKLLRLTLEAWGKKGFQEAVDRFYQDAPRAALVTDDREFESLFATWSAFTFAHWRRSTIPCVTGISTRRTLRASGSGQSLAPCTGLTPARSGSSCRTREEQRTGSDVLQQRTEDRICDDGP